MLQAFLIRLLRSLNQILQSFLITSVAELKQDFTGVLNKFFCGAKTRFYRRPK